MLKKRVIPTLLLKNNRMVKGVKYKNYRDVGNPISAVKIYNNQFADELMFIDINENKNINFLVDTLKNVSENCFIPLCAGGGIKKIDDIEKLLKSGADKVLVTSHSIKEKNFIKKAAKEYGNQCIVVGIDIKLMGKEYLVSYDSGKNYSNFQIFEYIEYLNEQGAGEILINFVDLDGEMSGTNLKLLKKICNFTNTPFITMGGIGNFKHISDVFQRTKAAAVACSSLFHFGSNDPIRLRSFLKNQNILQRKTK